MRRTEIRIPKDVISLPMSESPRICFLDRDGLLIEERHYLSDPNGVVLLSGVADALKTIRRMGFRLAVVSNQSGVARGLFSEETVREVDGRLAALLLEEGVQLDASLYCPHHPSGKDPRYASACDCRKPAPGMLRSLAEQWNADLSASVMIGDKLSDVEAGQRAGCCASLLVRTGHGKEEASKTDARNCIIVADLPEAAAWLSRHFDAALSGILSEKTL